MLNYKLSQFAEYLRNQSVIDIIRMAVLICLLSLFFGHSYITLDRDSSSLPFLLRGLVAFLYYAGKYFTIPLTMLGILMIIGNGNTIGLFVRQLSSLKLLFCFVIFMVIQIYFTPNTHVTESRLEVFYSYVFPVALAVIIFYTPQKILLIRNSFYLMGVLVVIMFLLSGGQGLFMPLVLSLTTDKVDRLVLASDTITSASRCLMSALAGMCILATNKFKKKTIICIIVSIILLIFMALGTGSKGPLVSFAVSTLVVILLVNIKFRIKVLFLILIVLAITIGYNVINTILPEAAEHLSKNDVTRTSMYTAVMHSEPTIFGEGVGTFNDHFGGFGGYLTYVHNMFLETYFETGIVGLILLVVLIGNLLFRMLKLYKHTKDPALLFCLTGFVYYSVCGQFTGYLLGDNGLALFFLLGTWLVALQQDKYKLANM